MVSSSHDIAATVSLGRLLNNAQWENDDVSLGRLQKAKGHKTESRGTFFFNILFSLQPMPKCALYPYRVLCSLRNFGDFMTDFRDR